MFVNLFNGRYIKLALLALMFGIGSAQAAPYNYVYDFEPNYHGWDTFSTWWGGAAVNYFAPYQGRKSGIVVAQPGYAAALGRTVHIPVRNYQGCQAKAWTLGDRGYLEVWNKNNWTGLWGAYNLNANKNFYTEVKTGFFTPAYPMYMRYVVVAGAYQSQYSRVDLASMNCDTVEIH